MNYKDNEKLSIPPQFSLAKYEPLKTFVTPIPWLDQFALRIDLMAHWEETIRKNPDCEPYQWIGCVDENYPEDLLRKVLDDPLPNVEKFVSSLPYVDFPTVMLVRNCAESIRPMTILDLITTLTMIPPKLRHEMGMFAPQLWSSFLNPAHDKVDPEQLGNVQHDDYIYENHSRSYPQHLLTQMLSIQMNGGIDKWMTSSVADYAGNDPVGFYCIDTSVPLKDAEQALRRHYLQAQARKSNSSRMDSSTFAKWCDDGIMPYIDLKIYEAIERFNRKRFVSITEEEMADAIYPVLPAVPPRSSTCVSDTTKPVALDFQNPFSSRFRLLLVRAAECEAHARLDD
jgi:hypothetical protein